MRNSNFDNITDEVSLKSSIPTFISFNEQGNSHLVYKDDNGFMIISGWYHAYGQTYSSNNASYNRTITFETPFIDSNYVICATPKYPHGLPHVAIVNTSTTSVTICCDVDVNGIWINWVAMGRWK